ncbi:hypothetical protein D3C78_1164590 [compost metagenome]
MLRRLGDDAVALGPSPGGFLQRLHLGPQAVALLAQFVDLLLGIGDRIGRNFCLQACFERLDLADGIPGGLHIAQAVLDGSLGAVEVTAELVDTPGRFGVGLLLVSLHKGAVLDDQPFVAARALHGTYAGGGLLGIDDLL